MATEDQEEYSPPAFQLVSDIHTSLNAGSKEKGFLESSIDLVAKGIPATLIAAGNELANIPATIGNMVMGKGTYEVTSNATRIADIDSDLARYYEDHQLGIDTAGFIVSSFVPGMAGTKVLRAGQTALKAAVGEAKLGSLTGAAMGILVPSRQKYLEAAISQIGITGNVFKLGETNLLKALAAGAGQEALEGAAWTVMVNATMNQSPILDQRDVSDMVWDVALGAGLGAAIGGTVRGIGAIWTVKKAATAAEQEVSAFTTIGLGGQPVASLSTSDKILFKLRQLDGIPEPEPTHPLAIRMGREAEKTKNTLKQDIRGLVEELADKDVDVAKIAFKWIDESSFENNLKNFLESQKISRVTVSSKIEKQAAEAARKVREQKLSVTDESVAELLKHKTTYVNTRTLTTSDEAPKLLDLADTATPTLTRSGLKVGKNVYQQTTQADISVLGHTQAEARYHWTDLTPKLAPDKVHIIGENDIPMMQKALRDGAVNVNIGSLAFDSADTLSRYIKTRQAEIAAVLKERKLGNNVIAKIVNASEDVLFGGMENPKLWNLRQHIRDTFSDALGADPFTLPSHLKIITKSEGLKVDGHTLEGMAIIAQKEKLHAERAARTYAAAMGEIAPDAAGISSKVPGSTAGPSFLASENANYGTQSSFWAYIGQRTHNLVKARKEATSEVFTPTLQKLAHDTDAAIEFSVLNETMRNLPQKYSLADDGMSLVYGKIPKVEHFKTEAAFEKAMERYTKEALENEAAGIPMKVELKSPLVRKLVADHITRNDGRRGILSQVHTDNGLTDRFELGTFYPVPRNPRDTPHFAFVVDQTVSGRGHSKMIYAKDGETLELMRNKLLADPELQERGLTVLTKAESEEYYKSIGQYEFERTISENYINTALARKGKSASFLPTTDPQKIVTDFLEWHQARDASLVRTVTEHRYSKEFETLRRYAAPSIEAAKSKFGYVSPLSYAENAVSNPAANMMKMALDISKVDEYPVWTPINKFLDEGFSKVYDKLTKAFGKATSSEHLDEINSALKKAGYQDVIVDSALYEAMNGKVARGKLTSIVNKANTILATFALRADPFNAINNAVGSSVLLGTELKAVMRAIGAGNEEAVGELAGLMKVKVPGADDFITSHTKMVASRLAKFHTDKAGRAWFKKHGFSTSITDQYDQTLDHIGIALANGDHTAIQKAMVGAKKLGDLAERGTGNKFAEELNRYVAAGVMKDITDVAIKHGLMDEQTALSYINTFVNRTQGNYLASQRPVVFQGAIGQAIGLFQTYQFNLLQQVFRHIGEGNKKDLLVMAGLQGGIYGMNGLPAFNAINTYIIGTAGGNTEHKNLYDAVLSGAGKEAGEWLLYGGLSNGLGLFHPDLKTNIYSRGDLNPRNITLLPVDPSKVPIYQATERLVKNVYDGFKQVAMGADVWGTFLRGIEQNGLSRPLTGLAQVLEAAGREDNKVISTNQQGNLLMVHDLYSLSSAMRILGAKPLDEAVVNDQMFRINSYRAHDAAKRKQLGEGIKTSILNGDVPDEKQIAEFAYAYAKTGGKQTEFAQFMSRQYANASVSQAEKLRQNLNSPYSKSLQYIMGGEE